MRLYACQGVNHSAVSCIRASFLQPDKGDRQSSFRLVSAGLIRPGLMAGYISRMSHSRPICTCAIISASILVDPTCVDHLALWKSTPQRKQRITDNRREKKTLGIQESCHGDREVAPVCAPITRFHVWMGLRYASRHRPPAHPRTVTLALSDPAPPRTVHASALRLRRITLSPQLCILQTQAQRHTAQPHFALSISSLSSLYIPTIITALPSCRHRHCFSSRPHQSSTTFRLIV